MYKRLAIKSSYITKEASKILSDKTSFPIDEMIELGAAWVILNISSTCTVSFYKQSDFEYLKYSVYSVTEKDLQEYLELNTLFNLDLKEFFLKIYYKYHYTRSGVLYGYPLCCIKSFIKDIETNSVLTRESRKLNGSGYIPCIECNNKYTVPELIENIQKNRSNKLSSFYVFCKNNSHSTKDLDDD